MSGSSTNSGSSSAMTSATAEGSQNEHGSQAGPLPSKRGEIGFVTGVHTPVSGRFQEESIAMPARHPADRDQNPPEPSSTIEDPNAPNATPSPIQDSSSHSITKSKRILGFLSPRNKVTCGGLRLFTLLLFAIQLAVFSGTIVGWVFATKLLNSTSPDGNRMPAAGSSIIFVHVVFGIATITQLIFLERRLYRLRGERYTYLHPGEVLPRFRAESPAVDSATIAFAPWNRPPLPTYAATLAQSGVGTGDVEDNIIAAPPPPAYGNTRGSKLLLAGYLSATQRAERPQSEYTEPGSRPVSYASREEPWQGGQQVDRSLMREETLNRLESQIS